MPTRRPLKDMLDDIFKHIEAYNDYLQFNNTLYKMYSGQIKEQVEISLKDEIISSSAYNRAIQRIPSINIVKKTVDKLSKVYAQPPKRLTDSPVDKEIMDNIIKGSNLDIIQDSANKLLNLNYGSAIEPFIENNRINFRVLGLHQFLPFSDDPINPLNMTVFIKLLGQRDSVVEVPQFSADGTKLDTVEEQVRSVNLYSLYSDDEYIIVDSEKRIRLDIMNEMGVTSTKNPFGVIPVLYINSSNFELIPYPNQAAHDISILIPKLLTDLNYAAQYMSHSIIYVKNTDIEGQEINPDAVVNLGNSKQGEGDPEIGTIDPKVQIESILQLVEFEFSAYMSSVGIKSASVGAMMPGREASGFAKAMDEGDATQERKVQVEMFRHFESKFWSIISKLQGKWGSAGLLKENRVFSERFVDTFSIKFPEMKILKSDLQKLEEIEKFSDLGLISRRQSLRVLMPDFTEAQLDKYEEELEEESKRKTDEMVKEASVISENSKGDEEENQRKETLGE
ncbi:hypothetical protein KAR91_24740 [Candidatus Pacearchaeota archaeon]|nr:hypothetical protein [Candidatus Pacearchaeota archaeon]